MSLQSDFITETRQVATEYREWITKARDVSERWSALWNAVIDESDFVGDNTDIIDNPTKLQSVTDVIGNIDTVIASFDAGIDTNFERIAL